MKTFPYAAFSGYGIEIEHIIVSRDTLDVCPVADQLLAQVFGSDEMDVVRENAAWSNELALHVIETKTLGPISDLEEARSIFRREVDAISELLRPLGARLMPTGMHPWMDPLKETRLWPHQNNEIYAAFDRIFNCQGHGWSNLQSMHINFPFQDESEFEKVHAACRFALCLLPALAASTPFIEGRRAPHLDQRLAVYRENCARIPSITGQVIPEPVYTEADYRILLGQLYNDIAPFDRDGILQDEWLNARGAIARFDRGAVEIRVIDTQECPEQDLALAFFVTEYVRALASQEFLELEALKGQKTENLVTILNAAVTQGSSAALPFPDYARAHGSTAQTLGELSRHLVDALVPQQSVHRAGLELICETGNLATRLVHAHARLGGDRDALYPIYKDVCDCLDKGVPFEPSLL